MQFIWKLSYCLLLNTTCIQYESDIIYFSIYFKFTDDECIIKRIVYHY